jgi:hypothetical protein
MDMGTGIGYDGPYWCFLKKICICVYDTYQIHKYVIFQKTPIRGYGSNILIIITVIAESRQQAHNKKPIKASSPAGPAQALIKG